MFDLGPRGAERGSILDPEAVVQIKCAWRRVRVTMAAFWDCERGKNE